jgi:hypothetical protein
VAWHLEYRSGVRHAHLEVGRRNGQRVAFNPLWRLRWLCPGIAAKLRHCLCKESNRGGEGRSSFRP